MGTIKDPENCEQITWPQSIFAFEDGTSFLLSEDGIGKDKMLVFATAAGKESMCSGKIFFMNGTFKTCSKQFYQLYTIPVDIRSNNNETNVVLVIYSLLSNKRTET